MNRFSKSLLFSSVWLLAPLFAGDGLIEISNKELSVVFSNAGAELQSIRHSSTNTEYLWQGDPEYWEGRSPNMFPVNVRFRDNRFTYKGEDFEMPFLGLAVTAGFEEVGTSPKESVVMRFDSSEETLEHYPFPFRLEIAAKVEGLVLEQVYTVTNTGTETLFYALGGHPGLRTPLGNGRKRSDYQIVFSRKMQVQRQEISGGLVTGKRIPYLDNEDRLALDDSRVPDGGMFLKNNESRQMGLSLKGRPTYVTVDLGNFPNTNIWTPPGMPYVCFEPMLGHHDLVDSSDAIDEKSYLLQLFPGESRSYYYTITINPDEGTRALR